MQLKAPKCLSNVTMGSLRGLAVFGVTFRDTGRRFSMLGTKTSIKFRYFGGLRDTHCRQTLKNNNATKRLNARNSREMDVTTLTGSDLFNVLPHSTATQREGEETWTAI